MAKSIKTLEIRSAVQDFFSTWSKSALLKDDRYAILTAEVPTPQNVQTYTRPWLARGVNLWINSENASQARQLGYALAELDRGWHVEAKDGDYILHNGDESYLVSRSSVKVVKDGELTEIPGMKYFRAFQGENAISWHYVLVYLILGAKIGVKAGEHQIQIEVGFKNRLWENAGLPRVAFPFHRSALVQNRETGQVGFASFRVTYDDDGNVNGVARKVTPVVKGKTFEAIEV